MKKLIQTIVMLGLVVMTWHGVKASGKAVGKACAKTATVVAHVVA